MNRIDTAKLRYYMEKKGLNKTSLAREAGISRSTVTAIFTGKDISAPVMKKVASTLEIPAQQAGEIFLP